jgi:NAD(P)-dependent dehydrogenase (short-subunit alcohol dehydrogenase family)
MNSHFGPQIALDFVMSQESKVVVITGASAGVGRATVREFARNGWRIGLLARGSAGLESAKAEVEALGGRALIIPADVADHAQVEAAAIAVESNLGPIDIWVNNAMVSVFSPVSEMSPEEFKRVTEVTYLGVVYGTMAALRFMRPRNRGTIVQVGSALAYRSIPLQSAYCGAKHGIRGFTDGLRSELLHDNIDIHLTMVQLPALNTPQFDWVKSRLPGKPQPVPPIFQPEVAARAIYWAAHHRRREVYVGLPTVKAIIANKIIPGYLDRYLAKNGYASQQTDERADPDAPDNLWHSLPGDYGAHGRFDKRARPGSLQLWFTTHRTWIAVLAAAAGATGFAYTMKRWNSTRWLSDLVRTAFRRPSKSPARAAPFASSKRAIQSAGEHVQQN